MKIKTLLLLSTLALAGTASAESRFFIGGSYGLASDGEISLDDAFNVDELISFEFGVKHQIQDRLSFSLSTEIIFGETDERFGREFVDVDSFGFMANVKLAYEVLPNLTIYGGAGIGFIDSELTSIEPGVRATRDSETVFAYQFIAGLEYQVTGNVALFSQFRYLSGEDFDFVSFTAIDDSFVDFGARFYF
ncbi:porin family protein [Akkermansiaceae bacterium]|nr:porin family protein [Akkermansiaceae bacterium]